MFILADREERCVLVTVYYIDISTSVSIGDIIEIPKPVYRLMDIEWRKEVSYKKISLNKYMEIYLYLEIFYSIVTCRFTKIFKN